MKPTKNKIKLAVALLALSISGAQAADPGALLQGQDAKVYSLRSKGLKDLVVDITNPELTRQLNESQSFGSVSELTFRVYWTASPERFAMEVLGLPEGFEEVKYGLKQRVIPLLENILAPPITQQFAGFKFNPGTGANEVLAVDPSGVAPISSFTLKFDAQQKLIEIQGHKVIGEYKVEPTYEKESFSEGKWVLKSQHLTNTDSSSSITTKKELDYGLVHGMGVVSRVTIGNVISSRSPSSEDLKSEEVYEFKNYQINSGAAQRYFLGETTK
jgi:hypothetical protein